ncbi:MAG: NAD-dependent protein deacylase [Desulfurococcales archaeon]|nr:NAD-dependent protein deacylase [Desulfurococcales archaeon]
MNHNLQLIIEAAQILISSRHAISLTGAGVSTPSGIPDFRGSNGLWKKVPPELFDITYFISNPIESWNVFLELYDSMGEVKPNPAHYSLARLEEMGVIKAIITQNIDGLHQSAGSKNVIELHGNLEYAKCIDCGYKIPLDQAIEEARSGQVPKCPRCGGIMKPDVVFFGETLPQDNLTRAFDLARASDAILVVGSSLYVTPARYIPGIVKSNGGKVILVNLGDVYPATEFDLIIEMPVEEALPLLCRKVAELLGLEDTGCP